MNFGTVRYLIEKIGNDVYVVHELYVKSCKARKNSNKIKLFTETHSSAYSLFLNVTDIETTLRNLKNIQTEALEIISEYARLLSNISDDSIKFVKIYTELKEMKF